MNIHTMQQFADMLKTVVLEMDAHIDTRLHSLRLIGKFEKCPWHSIAMQETIEEVIPGIDISEDWLPALGEGDTFYFSIKDIYKKYSQHIDCGQNDLDDIYDMREAAEFLDISYEMMRTYVTREKRIRGKRVGTSTAFTRQQLEDFRDNHMRPPGRPSQNEIQGE